LRASGPPRREEYKKKKAAKPIPRFRDVLASPLPHHPDVLLEAVSVAERGRREDRRSDPQVASVEYRVIVVVHTLEPVEQLAVRSDPKPPAETIVERRDRLAE